MDDQKIIELYEEGKSCQDIGDLCGCTSQQISKKLKKMGVKTRCIAGYYTPEELKKVREQIGTLRMQNLTFKEIGEIVGLSATSAWEHWKNSD